MTVSTVEAPSQLETHDPKLALSAGHNIQHWLWNFCQRPVVFLSALTFLALLIHGYHPYVDDAAIYVAGIEKIIQPSLFPLHAEYVLPHLKHALFSWALGSLIRELDIPLPIALFTAYLVSLWFMLFACWQLSCLLFVKSSARLGTLLLITATLTLPVAGTAIFFIDPYLTARSFSTPATLLAIAYALERRMSPTIVWLAIAFVLHPLMGAYATGYVLALWMLRDYRWKWLTACAVAVLLAGLATYRANTFLGTTSAYRIATTSRSYFFLNHWAWFEIFGLFPPLVASWAYLKRRNFRIRSNYACVAAASIYIGVLAIVFALLFTRTESTYLIARLQPLRSFQLIYILFFLLLGSTLGDITFSRYRYVGVVCLGLVAGIMFTVQRRAYPALRHIEWPWSQPQNPWEQAFFWIRSNTPQDAYFAIDPDYQSQPGEDTAGFRAATERGVLPDWNKDGGIAAIDPAIAQQWWDQVSATRNFSQWTDQQRIQILSSYNVSWIVLPARSSTQMDCPYTNSAVLVCRLPADLAALHFGPSKPNP